jgi:hypothetical protein
MIKGGRLEVFPWLPKAIIFLGSMPDDATNLNLLPWFYNRVLVSRRRPLGGIFSEKRHSAAFHPPQKLFNIYLSIEKLLGFPYNKDPGTID